MSFCLLLSETEPETESSMVFFTKMTWQATNSTQIRKGLYTVGTIVFVE